MQVYVSTGAGAKDALSYETIGTIIENMRAPLRAEQYGPAVEQAVLEIGLALAGKEIPVQHSSKGFSWDEAVGFVIFGGGVVALIGYSAYTSRKERVRYSVRCCW